MLNRRSWPGAATAALIIGIGQLGRLPVPSTYRSGQEACYEWAQSLAHGKPLRADVVVMGNSGAQFGISPDELSRHLRLPGIERNPRVINLAIPGASPAVERWLWRRVVSRGTSQPALLVLGLAPIDLTDKSPGTDYALRYLFSARDTRWLVASGQIDSAASLLTDRLFPLYARSMAVRDMIARRTPLPMLPRPPETRRWWIPAYYRWYRDYRVQPFQTRSLEQLITDARRQGVRVVVVALPVHPSLQAVTEGGVVRGARRPAKSAPQQERAATPLSIFSATIGDITNRHRIAYFNYLTPQQAVRFEYADPPHLAPRAAARFTVELAHRINAQFVPRRAVTVRRGDSPSE